MSLFLLALAACSDPKDNPQSEPDTATDSDSGPDTGDDTAGDTAGTPIPDPAVPAEMPFWTVVVPVSIEGGKPLPFLLDTGSKGVSLAPEVADGLEGSTISTLAWGGREWTDVSYRRNDLDTASGLLGVELGGTIGYGNFGELVVAIDYAGSLVYPLDAWHDAYDFGPGVGGPPSAIAWELAYGYLVTLPATFEGQPFAVILDTGTSGSVVSERVYDALGVETDGRPVLRGSSTAGSMGEEESPIFRFESATIGEATAAHMWTMVLPDDTFDEISDVIGVEVDAIVGGTWLREFLVVFDYPAGTLRTAPYADLSHVGADFQMVGIEAIREDSAWSVYTVFVGSDAEAQGIEVGDEILALDGQDVALLSSAEVQAALRGEPGTSLVLDLWREKTSFQVEVLREDLLPE